MENGQNMNASRTEDSFLMKSLDQREDDKSHSDIIARRIKNRERQRRYRARKRLEADMKKTSIVVNQSPELQAAAQVNEIVMQQEGLHQIANNCMTRIYCQRNWKKDARSINAIKEQEVVPSGPVIPDLTSAGECQASSLPTGVSAEPRLESTFRSNGSPVLDNTRMERIMSGRRHWKAEARNKKN